MIQIKIHTCRIKLNVFSKRKKHCHLFIHIPLIWGQQSKQRCLDLPFLCHHPQFFRVVPWQVWSWGFLPVWHAWNTSPWRHPGGIPVRCLNHLIWKVSLPERSSLSPWSMLQRVSANYIVKSYSFGHFPQSMAISEGRNVDWQINCQPFLCIQLFLYHNSCLYRFQWKRDTKSHKYLYQTGHCEYIETYRYECVCFQINNKYRAEQIPGCMPGVSFDELKVLNLTWIKKML